MTMIHAVRRRLRLRSRSGQGLVEFVLVAPLLLLLLFGIIEFARAWNIRHVVTDAAREGARSLAVDNANLTTDSVRVLINNALSAAGMDPALATVTLDDSGGTTGAPATVSIQYPYQLGVVRVLLGWALNEGQLNIGTTFVMRNE
jgi:Flp pilus assembly protein TadG